MPEPKQKKIDRTILVQGIAKKISKKFEKVIEDFEQHNRIKNQDLKTSHENLCREIEDLAIAANDCYQLYIGDRQSLAVNSRNPHLLVKYTHIFLGAMLELKKFEKEERQVRKTENEQLMMGYNQNNVYELVARKNIEFLELENQIKDLKERLCLAGERASIAEEMTDSVRQSSEEMLRVYRDNFGKMSDFLKLAEEKQNQLLQSNRLLNEQIQTLTLEFDIYKKNFKRKTTVQDKQRRLRERMQKQFDDKLHALSKQMEYQYKQQTKVK